MKVGFLTRYESHGASSRVRALQYEATLNALDIETHVYPLLSNSYLSRRYAGNHSVLEVARCYARRLRDWVKHRDIDLLWLEKEIFPYVPLWIEEKLLEPRRYVLDIDDAIFHSYDRSAFAPVRLLLGKKIDGLMAGAAMVIAGNNYLAGRAVEAGARKVEVLPSVIDLRHYSSDRWVTKLHEADQPARLVWIGSPATERYLNIVREPLQRLAATFPLEFRVIGASAPQWAGVRATSVRWTEATEVEQVRACDIGIMPLEDGPWERGKCGYKLIQYMACSLPVVASNVGANAEIVSAGETGFLATTAQDWEDRIAGLLADPVAADECGRRGRQAVEARYCLQVTGPRLAQLLREAAAH